MERKPQLVALAIALLPSLPSHAETETLSLPELFEQGWIQMNVIGTGEYQGECAKVTLTNAISRPVRTNIPPGWRFVSKRGPVQDLLVVREQIIALVGNGSTTVICKAFCCEASGEGPSEGEKYRRGNMATPELVAVAQAIAAGDYTDDVAQQAIWTLSNRHDIASMGALTGTPEDTLRMIVSRLSGQPPPLYTMRFLNEEGVICTGRPGHVERTLPIDLSQGAILSVVVIDMSGKIMQVLYDHTPIPERTHGLGLGVEVADWPPGRYAFQVHTDDRAGVHRLPFVI